MVPETMDTSSRLPLAIFMRQLNEKHQTGAFEIVSDNARVASPKFGHEHQSTCGSLRWEPHARKEPMDANNNNPTTSCKSLSCPERRISYEATRGDFQDYKRVFFAIQENKYSTDDSYGGPVHEKATIEPSLPPKCPQRRMSAAGVVAVVGKTELPDYKVALFAAQQRYATSRMPAILPTRRKSLDKVNTILNAAMQCVNAL
jgi:hypothetical protein